MKTQDIAVVILNWNGLALLKEFLPSVVANSMLPGCEIVVADNGSTDDSVKYIRETFSNINIIQLDKNYGFAEGYNRALSQISSQYYVLLNSDVLPAPNWLGPIVKAFESDISIGILAPKILDYKNHSKFEYAGAAGGFMDKYGYPFCRGRIFEEIENDNGQYDRSISIFWASGAALAIRSECYDKAGGLDLDFFAHMEEIDLCWRVRNLGYKIISVPESCVYHLGGGTLHSTSPHKHYLNFRNNLNMLLKNLPKNKLAITLVLRMCLDGVAALKYLSKGEFQYFFSIFKAHMHFYARFRLYYKKRLRSSMINMPQEVYPKSIVWQYFARNKRIYSDL